MQLALEQAALAAQEGEVPVGAVLVREGELLATGRNAPIATADPSAHAEILSLRQAARKLGNYRLLGTTLYVTLEPCPMCAGAMIYARVERLVFATSDPRTGAVHSVCTLLDEPRFNHQITWQAGVCQMEAQKMLQDFFRSRR